MADWYVSSAVFATVAAWQATHAYSVGDFVKATASPSGKEYVFRCTTAGTSAGTEPTWSTSYANNNTKTDGGVTWTNVTGQSTYGWSAAAGTLHCIDNANSCRPLVGDRVFVSSDHSESYTSGAAMIMAFNNSAAAYGLVQILSVNRAGSVPPVAADYLSGASISVTVTGATSLTLDCLCNMFWQGVTFSAVGTANGNIALNSAGNKASYFKNCAFAMTTTGICRLQVTSNTAKVTLDNTTVQFGNTSGYIGGAATGPFELSWINTPSAIPGSTFPTTLFQVGAGGGTYITCRGVDLSAITGTLCQAVSGINVFKGLFDSCRIASGVTRYSTPIATTSASDEIELVNCYDGTNVLNERYTAAGSITTDRSTTLSSGAQDDVGAYSLKLQSSTRSDFATFPLDCFAFDVENTLTGASKTATVEIISSGTLNNNDIRLLLEYMGTSGNPIASFGDSLASVLTAASALSSSSNTWNNPPATPQKQLLQVTFTPQRAGRVRGSVRLGKVSTTVWVNPQIAIT